MSRKNLHSALLVFLLQVVFITPLVVKGLHHHAGELHHSGKNVELVKHEGPCYVCNYEFVTFSETLPECLTATFFLIRTIYFKVSAIHFSTPFIFFSHRGPPVIS